MPESPLCCHWKLTLCKTRYCSSSTLHNTSWCFYLDFHIDLHSCVCVCVCVCLCVCVCVCVCVYKYIIDTHFVYWLQIWGKRFWLGYLWQTAHLPCCWTDLSLGLSKCHSAVSPPKRTSSQFLTHSKLQRCKSCYLWITLPASFRGAVRKRVRLTVNSQYQRPAGCICPPPLGSQHKGFGSLLSHVANLIWCWLCGWSHCL